MRKISECYKKGRRVRRRNGVFVVEDSLDSSVFICLSREKSSNAASFYGHAGIKFVKSLIYLQDTKEVVIDNIYNYDKKDFIKRVKS